MNTVSGSLVASPNLKSPEDPVRILLLQLMSYLSEKEPEFILKVRIRNFTQECLSFVVIVIPY